MSAPHCLILPGILCDVFAIHAWVRFQGKSASVFVKPTLPALKFPKSTITIENPSKI
jgi:hypothetical protein